MTGTAASPYTDPVPVPGGTATTSPSPFVTEIKADIADVEHEAEHLAGEAEHEAETVVTDVKSDAEHIFTEVKDDIEHDIHPA